VTQAGETAALQQKTQLLAAPEVALLPKTPAAVSGAEAKKHIAEFAAEVQRLNRTQLDGFVRKLMQERTELVGLPFRLGGDCQLGSREVQDLSMASPVIRSLLGNLLERQSKHGTASTSFHTLPSRSTRGQGTATDADKLALLPALMQILASEAPDFRRFLIVEQFRTVDAPPALAALERLAVFDPDAQVRREAVEALLARSPGTYGETLLKAFRYPWPEVARRAAEAIITLRRTDLLAKLVDILDEPDPTAPVVKETAGKREWQVRELVRINHHRNCLLCHAPGEPRRVARDDVVGLVPSPAEKLPPATSVAYYANLRPGDTAVTARVTYLRQDFSVMLPVANAKPWPELQRFDFLVRQRTLSDEEMRSFEQQRIVRGSNYVAESHQAVVLALQALTGKELGPNAAAWRRELGTGK
jgi:hypothetical protein